MNSLATTVTGALAAALLFAGTATAGTILVNPGFEEPAIDTGVEYFGAGDGWETFGGGLFTVSSAVVAPHGGDQSLKMFGGCCSGAFQQFPTDPLAVWNGGVWMLNSSVDPMAGGQVAAVNIEWIQADGTTQSAINPFISNGTFTAADAPVDEWTLQTITGDAPADAAFARIVVITGDFLPGGPGGAPFYDDAFFELLPTPVQDASWSDVKSTFE